MNRIALARDMPRRISMLSHSAIAGSFGIASILSGVAVAAVIGACSSTSTDPAPVDAGTDTAPSTCASPGKTTPGAADTHCQGRPSQPVNQSSCFIDAAAPADDAGADAGDAGADDSCDYEATMFGQEGDDDDCKYHIKWSSSALCEGTAGVTFTVTVTNKVTGAPVTGIPMGVIPEVFIPTDPTAACDSKSTHPSPTVANILETTPGSGIYSGNILFDAPGDWTVRFHIHEECADVLDDSPHGHAAFRVTLP